MTKNFRRYLDQKLEQDNPYQNAIGQTQKSYDMKKIKLGNTYHSPVRGGVYQNPHSIGSQQQSNQQPQHDQQQSYLTTLQFGQALKPQSTYQTDKPHTQQFRKRQYGFAPQQEIKLKTNSPTHQASPQEQHTADSQVLVDKTQPKYIIQYCSNDLLELEKEEILSYPIVYYYGQRATKAYNPMNPNTGFDDKENDYNPVVSDHIDYRYELLKLLGSGSFGKVYKAFDHKHRRHVAVKILKNKKKFRQQGLIEIKLMEKLRDNDVNCQNHCIPLLNRGEFRQHLFLVEDLLQCDLYAYLVKYNLQGLPLNQIRDFAKQGMRALAYAAEQQVIHADIKPENILLEREGSTQIQIIDWGSGAFVGQTLYTYIQSRYYRAPEVILNLPYSLPIDTWSMGCVFVELFTGQPIFPGENESDQIGKIAEFIGMVPGNMIQSSPRKAELFWNAGSAKPQLRTNHKIGSKSIERLCAKAGHEFIDLIQKMLVWDPELRVKPKDLLEHPFYQHTEGFLGSHIESGLPTIGKK